MKTVRTVHLVVLHQRNLRIKQRARTHTRDGTKFGRRSWMLSLPQKSQYHYNSTVLRPLGAILLTWAAFKIAEHLQGRFKEAEYIFRRLAYGLAGAIVALTVMGGALKNHAYATKFYPNHVLDRDVRASLDWLNSNSLGREPQVLLTVSAEYNFLSFIHTGMNQFLPGYHLSQASKKERWDRVLIAFRAFNLTTTQVESFLATRRLMHEYWGQSEDGSQIMVDANRFESHFFFTQAFHHYYTFTEPIDDHPDVEKDKGRYFRDKLSTGVIFVPITDRSWILARYREILQEDWQELLSRFKVDAIVVHKDSQVISQTLAPELLESLKLEYDNRSVSIYSIASGKSPKN